MSFPFRTSSSLGIPATFAELGVDRELFMSKLPLLAEKAFEDQCTTTNPRLPLIRELEEILRQSYDGLKPFQEEGVEAEQEDKFHFPELEQQMPQTPAAGPVEGSTFLQ